MTSTLSSRHRANTIDVKYDMLHLAGDSKAPGRVQIEDLEQHGFTNEDLSRVIYDKFKDDDLPDFLDYIGLERKGGLDRMDEIWTREKYFWFLVIIGSVVFNVGYLLAMDWSIFCSYTEEFSMEMERLDLSNMTAGVTSMMEAAGTFKAIRDPATRTILLNVAAIVATWEVSWIFVKLLHTSYIWWLFIFGRSEYRAFHAIMFFFQKMLPQFSTFSAIKLMAKVHPSLIYNEYLYYVSESSWRGSKYGLIAVSIWFFSKQFFCALAALGAFATKLWAVSEKLTNPHYMLLYRLGNVLALMNQCMGCVLLEVVLQDRLFLFVFGGQDAVYQDREHAYKNVYECRIARQIWQDYWAKGSRFKAIVLLATFDHYDLQKLLIESLQSDSVLDVKVDAMVLSPIAESIEEVWKLDAEESLEEDIYNSVRRSASETTAVSDLCMDDAPSQSMAMANGTHGHKGLASQRRPSRKCGSQRSISLARPESVPVSLLPPDDCQWEIRNDGAGTEDGSIQSPCGSHLSSVSSIGMGVVTRILKNEGVDWRDCV